MSKCEKPARAEHSGSFRIDVSPGVAIPDWSVVTSMAVGDALKAIFETCNWSNRWQGLSEAEWHTRCSILKTYARTGHAPSLNLLATATGISRENLQPLVMQLAARDIVVVDEDGYSIIGAYPFVDSMTEHRVQLDDVMVNAMCAIDALGAGAMLGRDTTIKSSCRCCGASVCIQTKKQGTALADFSPADIVIWAGIQYENNCAAHSLCTTMAFFCSSAHLKSWLASHPSKPSGYGLSLEEGFQLGKAIFMPLLTGGKEATVFS